MVGLLAAGESARHSALLLPQPVVRVLGRSGGPTSKGV